MWVGKHRCVSQAQRKAGGAKFDYNSQKGKETWKLEASLLCSVYLKEALVQLVNLAEEEGEVVRDKLSRWEWKSWPWCTFSGFL